MAFLISSDARSEILKISTKTGHAGLNRRLLRLLSISGTVRLSLVAVEFRLCQGYTLHGSHLGEHSLDWSGWRLARYTGTGTG